MSKRAIYVLTYDTQTEAQMNQWVQTIRTRAPKAPLLLIYDKTSDPKNESMADLNLHGLYEHFWLVFKGSPTVIFFFDSMVPGRVIVWIVLHLVVNNNA